MRGGHEELHVPDGGTFTGLNATTSEVIVADVTSGQPGANGQSPAAQSVPVPLSGNAATAPTLRGRGMDRTGEPMSTAKYLSPLVAR
jgi:hypothetical protein